MATVLSLHRGRIESLFEEGMKTAIRKAPIEGPADIRAEGIVGDEVFDLRYHGGPFKALCVYAREYYPEWIEYTGNERPHGSFGENLSITGLPDDAVCIGDVYTMGPVTIRVGGPRGPCKTLARYWGNRDLALETKRSRKTGWYAQVLTSGTIAAPVELVLKQRVAPEWNLSRFWDLMDGGEATEGELDFLSTVEWLDPDWQKPLRKRLSRLRSASGGA